MTDEGVKDSFNASAETIREAPDLTTLKALREFSKDVIWRSMESLIPKETIVAEINECQLHVERILTEYHDAVSHSESITDIPKWWNSMIAQEKCGNYTFGNTALKYNIHQVYVYEYIGNLLRNGILSQAFRNRLAYHMYIGSTPNAELLNREYLEYQKKQQHKTEVDES